MKEYKTKPKARGNGINRQKDNSKRVGQKGNQQMDELKRQSDINQSVGQKENQHID